MNIEYHRRVLAMTKTSAPSKHPKLTKFYLMKRSENSTISMVSREWSKKVDQEEVVVLKICFPCSLVAEEVEVPGHAKDPVLITP